MRKVAAVLLFAIGCTSAQSAPEIRRGTRELEYFAQGGHIVSGGRGDTSVFNAGARFGYGLFSLHSTSLRGTFEYVVEAIPIYYIAQPGDNTYGLSFTPFDIKYNFTAPRRFTPFLELGGGVLLTNNDVPTGTNKVNFTPQAGVGIHLPLAAIRHHLTLGIKYIHISNSGLSEPNPGINSIQFKLGFGKFR